MKAKKPPNLDSWLKIKLRRLSLQWYARNEAMKRARVGRNQYKCEACGNDKFRRDEVQADHIESVIPLTGEIKRPPDFKRLDLNTYCDRLFVGPDGWQCLCRVCHLAKTSVEDNYRMLNKANKRKK